MFFYLKDLSGQNQKDLSYHLGSFMAALQVMAPMNDLWTSAAKKGAGLHDDHPADGAGQNPDRIECG